VLLLGSQDSITRCCLFPEIPFSVVACFPRFGLHTHITSPDTARKMRRPRSCEHPPTIFLLTIVEGCSPATSSSRTRHPTGSQHGCSSARCRAAASVAQSPRRLDFPSAAAVASERPAVRGRQRAPDAERGILEHLRCLHLQGGKCWAGCQHVAPQVLPRDPVLQDRNPKSRTGLEDRVPRDGTSCAHTTVAGCALHSRPRVLTCPLRLPGRSAGS
jgi:hypothetical protein